MAYCPAGTGNPTIGTRVSPTKDSSPAPANTFQSGAQSAFRNVPMSGPSAAGFSSCKNNCSSSPPSGAAEQTVSVQHCVYV